MKIDDIFEAMTDIDDKFIEAARPLEQYDDTQPIVIKPAPRRAVWKTLVPAAAFVAVVAAAGVVGVNYLHGRIGTANPAASVSNSIAFRYPEEAKYIVDSDIKPLIFWSYPSGSPSWIDAHVDYANSYEELAEQSDLIVSGTFIDDIHQMQDVNDTIVADGELDSYNTLEIDRVIKGDVSVGDSLIIHQSSTIGRANASDDKHLIFCLDQLSPMLKGDKWVYFLKLEDDGTFSPVNGPQGRYPLPNSANRLISSDGETPNVDEYFTYENAALAREEIYEELLKKLAEIKASELERIFIPEASFTPFTMPEFPDVEFNASRLGVTANDADIFDMKDDETLENLFLADLNGDGKRELCATISGAATRVAVRDYENELYYTLGSELDCSLFGENRYSLSTDTGTAYTNSDVNNEPCWIPEDNEVLVVQYTVWLNDRLVVKTQELTLDMLKLDDTSLPLLEVPLLGNTTFTLPDFEGFEFELIKYEDCTAFVIDCSAVVLKKQVEAVYFCDLDGDGQREIILSEVEDESCGVWVYGIMYDGELGSARYPAEGDGRVMELGGKLILQTDSGMKDFNYSKSDLKRVRTDPRSMWGGTPFGLGDPGDYGYYEFVPDDEHSVTSLNDFFPKDDNYSISIENGTLLVSRGNETLLKTGKLEELYGVTDAENNCLLFVYSNESGGIDAFILTENNNSKLVHIDSLVDNNVVLTDHRDVSIDFKDGRGVSLIRILSLIYK